MSRTKQALRECTAGCNSRKNDPLVLDILNAVALEHLLHRFWVRLTGYSL